MEFPKMLYYKGNADKQQIVNSAEEEDALGADWIDAPVDPLVKPARAKKSTPAPVDPAVEPPAV